MFCFLINPVPVDQSCVPSGPCVCLSIGSWHSPRPAHRPVHQKTGQAVKQHTVSCTWLQWSRLYHDWHTSRVIMTWCNSRCPLLLPSTSSTLPAKLCLGPGCVYHPTAHLSIALHTSLLHCIRIYYTAHFSFALHTYLLHRTLLYCTAYLSIPHHTSLLHWILIYCTAHLYIALYNSLLHCILIFYTAHFSIALHTYLLHITLLYCYCIPIYCTAHLSIALDTSLFHCILIYCTAYLSIALHTSLFQWTLCFWFKHYSIVLPTENCMLIYTTLACASLLAKVI